MSGNPEDPVTDLLFDLDDAFALLWERRVVVEMAKIAVPVIGLADLLVMKEKAGRAKDLADIAHITGNLPPDENRPYS